MNFSTFRFTLDLHKHQSQMSIAVFKNDTAVRLCMSLTDGGNPYFIEDGCTAILYGVKPNGKPIIHSCAIENNTRIIYDFNSKTANLAGIVDCQLRLYKGGVPLRDENGDIVYEGGEPILDEEGNHKTDENGKLMYTEISICFREDHQIITAPRFIIVVNESLAQEGDSDLDDESLTKNDCTAWEDVLLAEKLRQDAHNQREKRIQALEDTYDTKRTKIEEANKIYGTAASEDGDVEQVAYDISTTETPGVAFRTDGGQLELPEVTEDKEPSATQAVPRSYVDKIKMSLESSMGDKLNKTDEIDVVYANGVFGAISLPWSEDIKGDAVVVRRPDGSVPVLLTPYNKEDATSKIYVDNKDNENSEAIEDIKDRVEQLESSELVYVEDKTKAYEKIVPNDIAFFVPSALIKSIGGASLFSNNLLDPTKLTANQEITVNEDGSITFVIPANSYIDIRFPSLPIGTYYCSNEIDGEITGGNSYINDRNSPLNPLEITSPDDVVRIELENIDWSGEGGVEDSNITMRLMISKEDLPFEPYFPPKNAEVERVESIGANVIPFPYVYQSKVMDVGYKETINGVTFEVLENGLVSAIGTATALVTLHLFRKIMPEGDYYLSGKYATGGTLIGGYNHNAPNYELPQNGVGTINQKFTHAGGMFTAYIKINSGVTVNSVFSPIITKDVYVKDFKPYRGVIDSFSISVDKIKAKVDDYGKGIDSTDYNYIECIENKKFYWQKCKELVLKGTETVSSYNYGGMNGVLISSILDTNYYRAKAICTDTDKTKESDVTANSMWLGASNKHIYWVGVLDYLGLSTIGEFKTYLANRYANGNPVRILYKLAEPKITDITDLFAEDNAIEVEGGGSLRFVNENNLPVPSYVVYVRKKGEV